MMKRLPFALIVFLLPLFAAAQEELLPTGVDGVSKRGWVLLNTSRFVKGEQEIEVPEMALGGRTVNYVAFYVDGELVAVDELPPFTVTHDFGSYTHKARIIAIGVLYEIEPDAEAEEAERARGLAGADMDSEQGDRAELTEPVASNAIRITAPRDSDYAYGLQLISAEVDLPTDRVLRVDFTVDDRQAGSAGAPPYEVEFDFGRGFAGRLVRAIAVLADGRQLVQELRTRPLEESDYYIRARLVTLEATVVDWRDRLIGDLKREEFRVFENGVEQKVSHFALEERPLRVALLIDTSGSMRHRGRMGRAQVAAQQFLYHLKRGQDKAALISFTDQVNVISRFTDDFKSLDRKIADLEPEGGTAINDALDRVVPLFDEQPGRKAIILVSDGYDENSEVSIDEAVENVRRAGIKVYSIAILESSVLLDEAIRPPKTRRGVEPDLDPEDARRSNRPLDRDTDPRKVLFIGLADQTGGAVFFPRKERDLQAAFERIADELRNMYSLGYVPADGNYDGRWRKIAVKTTRGGLTVKTKKGYYAEK